MLPTLNEDNGHDFINNYYCVGHTWTECNEKETLYQLQSIKIYLRIGMNMKMTITMTNI